VIAQQFQLAGSTLRAAILSPGRIWSSRASSIRSATGKLHIGRQSTLGSSVTNDE
jgi:hypothetical protein